jgi:uncharacterized membrane protein YhhN
MTTLTAVLLIAALLAGVGDWVAVSVGSKPAEYACKPATLSLLLLAAVALDPADGAVRWWFVAALALSLLGDVFLMLPGDRFVPGLAAFLLAHLAYVVGMHVAGVQAGPLLLGVVVVAVAMAVIGTRVVRAVRTGPDPALAGPVVAYMLVISAMVASAVGTRSVLLVVGATLFYASDALIAWNRFVAPVPRAQLAIMTTYHLGQAGLVLALI